MSGGGTVAQEWGGSFPFACDEVNATGFDSDGVSHLIREHDDGSMDGFSRTSSPSVTPCLETSVLTFATHDVDYAGNAFTLPASALGSSLLDGQDPGEHVARVYGAVNTLTPAGHLHLELSHSAAGTAIETRVLPPAANGDVLHGLPVVAFLAVRYVNANVSAGVLSNYSSLTASKASVVCTSSSGGSCP